MDNIDLSVVIVGFYSSSRIFNLYETLPRNIKIIIVDNSDEGKLKSWAEDKCNIKLISLEENIGFGSACNLGAANCETDWLLFLNPDSLFTSSTINGVNQFLKIYPDAKCFAPVLRNEKNEVFFKSKCVISRPRKLKIDPSTTSPVPFLSGAALFVKKDAFDSVGGFDPNIFLFFEDDDLTYRLHLAYGKNYLSPLIQIIHLGGKSSDTLKDVEKIKKYYWGKSEIYLLRKHKGNLIGITLAITHLLKLLNPMYVISKRKFILQAYKVAGILGINIDFQA
jgi:N-acetylglucosaminyl-diphospho-decaprenol L-rhamnosyltransferase